MYILHKYKDIHEVPKCYFWARSRWLCMKCPNFFFNLKKVSLNLLKAKAVLSLTNYRQFIARMDNIRDCIV